MPVPARLFWSVTIYDPLNRSEGQDRFIRGFVFRPDRARRPRRRMIKTIRGKGWFVYFPIYGPETSAFDGSWKPGDFELVK